MSAGFLLVTGSRYAGSALEEIVRKELWRLWNEATSIGVCELAVVHGGASGVDAAADAWARSWPQECGLHVTDMPAQWGAPCRATCRPGHRRTRRDGSDYCPAQGNYRNQQMVDFVATEKYEKGAWVAVAAFFHTPDSRGTLDCVRRAKRRNLDVREFGNAPQRGVPPVRDVRTPPAPGLLQADS